MKPHRVVLVASVAAILAWAGYRAYRAHANLVTLNVRNMELRRVVSKIEWQTWERIVVNKNVNGRITLNVHSVPLEEVLNIIGLQSDSQWMRLYPVYLTSRSLDVFKQVLHGDQPPAGNGWSALQQLAAWQQAGIGGFANALRAENKIVSAQFVDKDMAFTALALSRFSKAQVVPEEGISGVVNLSLREITFDKAVARVARQVRRKWDRIYTLQPLNANAWVRKTPAKPAGIVSTNTDSIDTNTMVAAAPNEPVLPPDRAFEALTSTMTPDQRQQTLDQISAANQAGSFSRGGGGQQQGPGGGGGGALSPAAQAAQAAAQEDMEARIENRLKNGTIDQRLAHDRRVLKGKQPGAKP